MLRRGSFLLLSMGILACSEAPEESRTISQGQTLQNVVVEDLRNSIGFQGFDHLSGKATASLLSLGWDVAIDYSGTLQFYPTTTAKPDAAQWSYSATPMLMRGTATYETAPATRVIQDDQGLHLTHNSFVQHFESKGDGLHWRFTVPQRLAGDAALTLRIATPEMEHRLVNGKIEVIHKGTTWFEWSTFRAWDAQGKELALKVRVDGHSMAMEIDDRNAVYPIEIDPVASTPFWSVIAPDSEAGGRLGGSVKWIDANGDGFVDALVGQSRYGSDAAQGNEGRVLLFAGSAAGLSSTASWTYESDLNGVFFGTELSLLHDINGDGIADFAVSAPRWTDVANNLTRAGAVYVFHSGVNPSLSTTLFGAAEFEFFGISMSGEGDINCDGDPDLVIGSLLALTGTGKISVYLGNGTSYSTTAAEVFVGVGTENLGASLAIVGDINNDMCDDLVVGSPNFGATGRVQLYLGSSTTLQAPVSIVGLDSGAQHGATVSGAGDINNDGFADVVVGAPFSNRTGFQSEGSVYVYYGSAIGLSAPTVLRGGVAQGRLGTAVSYAGDINNDGFADIIAGAREYSNGEATEGRAVVYQGTAAGIHETPIWSFEPNVAGAQFGQSVHGGADANGDGFDDLLIGAQGFPSTVAAPFTGAVYAFAGSADCFIGGEFLAPGAVNPANPCEVCNPAVSRTDYSNGPDAVVCDDGDLCTTASACQAGVCVGTTQVDCTGLDSACEVGVCDSATGLCESADRPTGTTCDDGLFCTVNGVCDGAGVCVGTARDCSSAAAICYDGVACDETNDLCVPANPTAVGTTCGGDLCVTEGTCDGAGTCSGEAAVDCSNLDDTCMVGVCNPGTGVCEAAPVADGTTCDDNDLCTQATTCSAGVCGGTAVTCPDDANECTAPTCDSTTGCGFENLAFGTTCSTTFCSLDGTSVSGGVCDGSGACGEDTTTMMDCAPFVCGTVDGEAGCLTACEGNEDCQGDLVCENAACVEPMQGDEDPDMGEPDMGEPDMGEPDMGEPDMGEPDMGEDVGPTDMGEDAGPVEPGRLEGSGCSCSTTNSTDSSWLLVFAFGLIGFVRRRF